MPDPRDRATRREAVDRSGYVSTLDSIGPQRRYLARGRVERTTRAAPDSEGNTQSWVPAHQAQARKRDMKGYS
jgi:hypothetical protein